uniref:BTB domain-containing protein n=1 Tax=Panagrolaimus sp. ES5 TaxID=591445 RepID=A0AC34FQZ2_9BILA
MVIDFTQPSQLRQFELIIEERSLFVNQHYLAELSPYFLALCFTPEFRETREGRVEITDISFDDMLELLQHICPDDDFIMRSNISVDNFAVLTHLSQRLLLTNLRREVERFASSDASIETWLSPDDVSATQLLEIIIEAISAHFSNEALNILCKQLAKKDESEVNELLTKIPQEFRTIIQPKFQHFIQYFRLTNQCLLSTPMETYHKRLFF